MERPDLRGRDVVCEFVGGGCTADEALTAITSRAVAYTQATMGGLNVLTDGARTPRTVGCTDPAVAELDAAQHRSARGPGVEVLRSGVPVTSADVQADGRWPELAAVARQHGIVSAASFPVLLGGLTIAALDLFAATRAAFTDLGISDVETFVRDSAVVVGHEQRSRLADHLQIAMGSRAAIEQAKGVIMATTGCDAERAFAVLRDQSQRENRKLREVALELVTRQRHVTR